MELYNRYAAMKYSLIVSWKSLFRDNESFNELTPMSDKCIVNKLTMGP